MFLALTLLGGWIFYSFIFEVVRTLGAVPESVSQSYYALDSKGWHFIAVMLLVAITLCYPILALPWNCMPLAPVWTKLTVWGLGLGSIIGICMVALSPEFRTSKSQHTWHYIGSLLAMMTSQAYISLVLPWAFFGWIPVIGWKLYTMLHHHTANCKWWEIEAFDDTDWLFWMELGFIGTLLITLFSVYI